MQEKENYWADMNELTISQMKELSFYKGDQSCDNCSKQPNSALRHPVPNQMLAKSIHNMKSKSIK